MRLVTSWNQLGFSQPSITSSVACLWNLETFTWFESEVTTSCAEVYTPAELSWCGLHHCYRGCWLKEVVNWRYSLLMTPSGMIKWVLNFWKFKPLWSGMGEVVPARTSLTLHPPSPPTVASIVVTSTLRVNPYIPTITGWQLLCVA